MHDAQREALGRQREALATEMNHMESEIGESTNKSDPIDSNQTAWRASSLAFLPMPAVPVLPSMHYSPGPSQGALLPHEEDLLKKMRLLKHAFRLKRHLLNGMC